ncbi:hypothetical protein FH972_020117 [Carpinus fangiana]|uniref:Uncharacterized protein n=1 Tax=Carpinus fangiana TaxID=176857 RepID=A0A5N6RSQ8_9ROSI|nr:hypothetical protein FH972_020117 [Carpinus fangiana]
MAVFLGRSKITSLLLWRLGRSPPEVEGTGSDHTRGHPGTQATGGDHSRGRLMGLGTAAAALVGAAVEAWITKTD